VNTILQAVPVCLYMFVGIVSLAMARKSLFSHKYLPFHEAASGKPWEAVDVGLQFVLIALLRVSGLGFLLIGFLLVTIPVVNCFYQNPFMKYAIPTAALVYCVGLFLINYQLHTRTNAQTPWQRSLYAAVVVLVGIVISFA
jgi:hypothetical protein